MVKEDALHFFERLPSRLGEEEEDVDGHGGAKDAEKKVDLPLDVFERWRDKIGQGEVEGPIRRRAEGDGLASNAEWE